MSSSDSSPHSTRGSFAQWLSWLGLSAGGLSLAFAISGALPDDTITLLILLPGLTCGTAQWFFFRSLPKAGLWIAVTAASYPLLAFAFLFMLGPVDQDPALDSSFLTVVLISSVFLIPIGVAQWIALRRWFQRPGLWIPTAYLGWLLAFTAAGTLLPNRPADFLARLPEALALGVLGAILGALQAALTGVLLISLKAKTSTGA